MTLGSDFYIRNNLASSQSNVFLYDPNSGSTCKFTIKGSSFATSGMEVANTGGLVMSGGALNLGTSSANSITFWTNNTQYGNVINTGKWFLGGSTTATAWLHLPASTTAASTAPLKFTSGTNMTTAEAGAFEYNGTNLFFTRSGTTRESVITVNAVNSVSPVLPNRTLTVVIDGTTYYIHAKTTND